MPKSKTTSQKLAELRNLGKECRDKLWRRLQLTDEIIRDTAFVEENFGSETKLVEVLEANEWAEFANQPGLTTLLRLYRAFPERKTWAEYQYNWYAIFELSKGEPKPSGPRTNWKAECEKLALRIKELEIENRTLRDLLEPRRVEA